MRIFSLAVVYLLLPGSIVFAQEHEYADIKKVDLRKVKDYVAEKTTGRDVMIGKLPDFTLPDTTGEEIQFYRFLKDESGKSKKLVMLTFMRADCDNTGFEAPIVSELYERYREKGFDVIGVLEYSEPDLTADFLLDYLPSFTLTIGTRTKSEDDVRFLTQHYRLRRSLGDDRKWGTPFSFLIPDGDLSNVWFCAGEFKPGELEEFLEKTLQ